MPMYPESNLWLKGDRLYVYRSGQVWSILGRDEGPTDMEPGR